MTCTKEVFPDKDAWLQGRQGFIGASDIAAILGLNPYCSAYELWHQKKELIAGPEETMPMRLGLLMEPVLRTLYEETTGRLVEAPEPFTLYRLEDEPFSCTPDAYRLDDGCPVELKTAGEFMASEWANDEAPLRYQAQLQWQMMIMDKKAGALCCLVGNRRVEVREYERNDKFLATITPVIKEFADRLEADDPPPTDGSASSNRTWALLHGSDNGAVANLPELEQVLEDWKVAKEREKHWREQKEHMAQLLKEAIGDHTYGVVGDAKLALKRVELKPYAKVAHENIQELDDACVDYKLIEPNSYRSLREVKF